MKQKPSTALVCLNGDLGPVLPFIHPTSYPYILAVDGGLNSLLKAEIQPNRVIGDLDSATPESLDRARDLEIDIVQVQEQETTDFEKALQHIDELGYQAIDVIGFRGTRLDHELASLEAASLFADHIAIRILDGEAEGYLLSGLGEKQLNRKMGHTCSVMPIHPCEGVTLTGFKWPLTQERLGGGFPYSLSNVIVRDRATVTVRNGTLLIYLHRKAKD